MSLNKFSFHLTPVALFLTSIAKREKEKSKKKKRKNEAFFRV